MQFNPEKYYPMTIDGKYEITEMELWEKKDIDLTETGYFNISGSDGNFHFICVDGQMDIKKQKGNHYKFSWEGNDECTPVSGFGDFIFQDNTLIGRIYFHDGDDSSFLSRKMKIQKK